MEERLDRYEDAVHTGAIGREHWMSAAAVGPHWRASVWPLLAAPFAAVVYYLALRAAVAISIESSPDTIQAARSEFDAIVSPRWGSHWAYRIVTEVIAVGFATFVAAGLARGRERSAAILGSLGIALGFLIRFTVLLLVWITRDASTDAAMEPWYQIAVDGLMVIASPFIAFAAADAASDLNAVARTGFGGINRLHFFWLWVAAFGYMFGLVSPVFHFYMLQFGYFSGFNPFTELVIIITLVFVDVIPISSLMIPCLFGLALLSGRFGTTLHPVARDLLGVLVLVAGLAVGACIQIGWQRLFQWLLY